MRPHSTTPIKNVYTYVNVATFVTLFFFTLLRRADPIIFYCNNACFPCITSICFIQQHTLICCTLLNYNYNVVSINHVLNVHVICVRYVVRMFLY